MNINSKAEYFQLMAQGCLGNTLRNWRSVLDAYYSGVHIFGLREVGIAGGGAHEIVFLEDLASTVNAWRLAGRFNFVIDEAAPDQDVQLQGELCRDVGGWVGRLGVRTAVRMREAMRQGLLHHVTGVTVVALLDQFVDPSSRGDMEDLLELYPDAVIEFASYPYCLGKIPGRNTLIWEVRNY